VRAAATATVKGELAEQLQWALGHRVLMEQGKGVLMEREGLSPARAFARLRTTARTVGRTVGELAGIVLAGGSLSRHREPNPTGKAIRVAVAAAVGDWSLSAAGLVVPCQAWSSKDGRAAFGHPWRP
jgi:hypothetical protein